MLRAQLTAYCAPALNGHTSLSPSSGTHRALHHHDSSSDIIIVRSADLELQVKLGLLTLVMRSTHAMSCHATHATNHPQNFSTRLRSSLRLNSNCIVCGPPWQPLHCAVRASTVASFRPKRNGQSHADAPEVDVFVVFLRCVPLDYKLNPTRASCILHHASSITHLYAISYIIYHVSWLHLQASAT